MVKKFIQLSRQLICKILQLSIVVSFSKKYPGAYRFFLNRFDKSNFSGMPLTLLSVLFSVNLFLLSEISEKVINSGKVRFIDDFVANTLFKWRSEWLANFFYYITVIGNTYVVVVSSGSLCQRCACRISSWRIVAATFNKHHRMEIPEH